MNKKVSVIVPVYGTEKYLEKCINSILNQTYKNIEIIIVNDASPDNSQAIIDRYVNEYSHIKSVVLQQNKGLFNARLEGFDVATGDYIAFVDSDDYVGKDAYRVMVAKALETSSDVVFGNIVIEWEVDGRQETHIYNEPKFDVLEGDEILKQYIGQEGYTFFWYAAWNKLFTKEIFDKSREYFNAITEHTIMAEDIAFCSVLLAMANKISSIEYYTNYYLQSYTSSTSRNSDINKYKKNVTDMCRVMDFVENFIHTYPRYAPYKDMFKRFKEVFVLYWMTSIMVGGLNKRDKKTCINLLRKKARMKTVPDHDRVDRRNLTFGVDRSFIYCQLAKFNNKYENIIKSISSQSTDVVILPFNSILFHNYYSDYNDYIQLLKMNYNQQGYKEYISIRKASQQQLKKDGFEVSLDAIYNQMENECSKDMCSKLKSIELDLLKRLHQPRKSIKQLFDLSLYLNKKIMIVTDRLFDKKLTKDMLSAYNYIGYESIISENEFAGCSQFSKKSKEVGKDNLVYISSEMTETESKTKNECTVFSYPTPINHLYNNCEFFEFIKQSSAAQSIFYDNLLNRCALVTAANMYYDNPFRPISDNSDYNKDAYFMGLFPIAFFTLAICTWISDSNYNEFVIRNADSRLIKKSFDYYAMAAEKQMSMIDINSISHKEKEGNRVRLKISYGDDQKYSEIQNISDINSLCIYGDSRIDSQTGDVLHLFYNKNIIEIVRYLMGEINPNVERFYSETLIRFCIEKGVEDFMKNLFNVYGNHIADMPHNYESLSYTFDYFLNQSKYEDISVFDYCRIYVYDKGKDKEYSLFRRWLAANPDDSWLERRGDRMSYYPFLNRKPEILRALFFLIFDPEVLIKKMKTRFGGNKRIYKVVENYEKRLLRKKQQK